MPQHPFAARRGHRDGESTGNIGHEVRSFTRSERRAAGIDGQQTGEASLDENRLHDQASRTMLGEDAEAECVRVVGGDLDRRLRGFQPAARQRADVHGEIERDPGRFGPGLQRETGIVVIRRQDQCAP